jgi:hypothetical protein
MARAGVERHHRWLGAGPPKPISVKAASYAWRHFVGLIEGLPADHAAPLWQAAQAQATKALESAKSSRAYEGILRPLYKNVLTKRKNFARVDMQTF